MSTAKIQTGTLRFILRVHFALPRRTAATRAVELLSGMQSYAGDADVYAFQPDDKRCKVTYAAVVRGIALETMCSSSGDVGMAVLGAAGLRDRAKNSSVVGEYDTYPAPIGCPADRPEQVLVFYRKDQR